MMRAATSCLPMLQLLAGSVRASSFGKMSSASFQAIEDATLQAFWDCSPADESSRPPMAGELRDMSRASKAHTASHGECLTLNLCEFTDSSEQFPNAVGVSSLSDIVETSGVPSRFYLSARACEGILRRAEKRRKSLPFLLMQALRAVAAAE